MINAHQTKKEEEIGSLPEKEIRMIDSTDDPKS